MVTAFQETTKITVVGVDAVAVVLIEVDGEIIINNAPYILANVTIVVSLATLSKFSGSVSQKKNLE